MMVSVDYRDIIYCSLVVWMWRDFLFSILLEIIKEILI